MLPVYHTITAIDHEQSLARMRYITAAQRHSDKVGVPTRRAFAYRLVDTIISTENIIFELAIPQPFGWTVKHGFLALSFVVESTYIVEPPPSHSIVCRTSGITTRRRSKGIMKTIGEDLVFGFVDKQTECQLLYI